MTIIHRNLRPATDDRPKLPGMAPKAGDETGFNPLLLPWSFKLLRPKGRVATILNAANEPIGMLDGNTHTHLMDIIKTIEDSMRPSEDARYFANAQQREAQRRF